MFLMNNKFKYYGQAFIVTCQRHSGEFIQCVIKSHHLEEFIGLFISDYPVIIIDSFIRTTVEFESKLQWYKKL